MSYYITIYIYPINLNIPHTFLGFTKGKSPDKLDKQDDEIRQEKIKNADWKDSDRKWYENIYLSILSDDFQGEGFFGFAPVKSKTSHWGKVLKI